MSERPGGWYETPGDAEYPDVTHDDVPVKVAWWWSEAGRAEKLAEAWDEGVIAGFNRQNSTVWDLNP